MALQQNVARASLAHPPDRPLVWSPGPPAAIDGSRGTPPPGYTGSGRAKIPFAVAAGWIAMVKLRRNRCRVRVPRFSSGPAYFAGGRSEDSKGSQDRRADLFLQLPLPDAVLLSGVLARDQSKVRMLPPPSMPLALAIVPVEDGSGASCVPFRDRDAESLETLRRLSPGPLQPVTAVGKALKCFGQRGWQEFKSACKYEHMRAAFGGSPALEEQAETLLLNVYLRFCHLTGAPPRPCADEETDYDLYISVFQDAPMKALNQTCSNDFCLIAEAHVLGLAGAAGFPRMSQKDARAMYSSAMRFGYAVRQAEIRFKADGAAGTFVPLPLESEMVRQELEHSWARPAVRGGAGASMGRGSSEAEAPLSDADAAQRSLQEVLARLRRIGETKPALATYLGWLGKFDPKALSMLSTPTPAIAVAMRSQVDAVWGKVRQAADATVTTTPSDMMEAIVLGAWLHDCEAKAREARLRLEAWEQDGS